MAYCWTADRVLGLWMDSGLSMSGTFTSSTRRKKCIHHTMFNPNSILLYGLPANDRAGAERDGD
jgi:hypothetical protein